MRPNKVEMLFTTANDAANSRSSFEQPNVGYCWPLAAAVAPTFHSAGSMHSDIFALILQLPAKARRSYLERVYCYHLLSIYYIHIDFLEGQKERNAVSKSTSWYDRETGINNDQQRGLVAFRRDTSDMNDRATRTPERVDGFPQKVNERGSQTVRTTELCVRHGQQEGTSTKLKLDQVTELEDSLAVLVQFESN